MRPPTTIDHVAGRAAGTACIMPTEAEIDPAPSVSTIAACEKYLDRILAKTEVAKQDLEKNWMAQITVIALSIALVAGLGGVVARKLFDDPDRYTILYLIFPIVNTFLFVRFGLIGSTFSKARYNAELATNELYKLQKLPDSLDLSQIYSTNSYFEWAHKKASFATLLFLMTIPVVFSLNHALTIYLLYKFSMGSTLFGIIVGIYVVICGMCYWAYYKGNKGNTPVFIGKENLFIIGTIAMSACVTLTILFGLYRYDPHPGKVAFEINARQGTAENSKDDNAAQLNSR